MSVHIAAACGLRGRLSPTAVRGDHRRFRRGEGKYDFRHFLSVGIQNPQLHEFRLRRVRLPEQYPPEQERQPTVNVALTI